MTHIAPDSQFVVVVDFEYDKIAKETKLLGICSSTYEAFDLISDFDYKAHAIEVCPGSLLHDYILKNFGIDKDTKKMFLLGNALYQDWRPER